MTYVRPDGRRTRETAIPIIVIVFIIILIIIPTVPVADNRLDRLRARSARQLDRALYAHGPQVKRRGRARPPPSYIYFILILDPLYLFIFFSYS